jgi:hypothetical protein
VLNPVLDELGMWRGLERVIEKVSGMQRRPDPTVQVKGHALAA